MSKIWAEVLFITTHLYKKDKTENTKTRIHKPDKKHFITDFNLLFYYCFFFHRPSRYLGTFCVVTWTELASATWCWCVTSSPWWSGRKWRTSVPLLTSSIHSWGSVFGPQVFFNITGLFLSDGIIHVQISYSYTRIKSITLKSLKFLHLPPPQQIKAGIFIFMVTQFLLILQVYPLSMN